MGISYNSDSMEKKWFAYLLLTDSSTDTRTDVGNRPFDSVN